MLDIIDNICKEIFKTIKPDLLYTSLNKKYQTIAIYAMADEPTQAKHIIGEIFLKNGIIYLYKITTATNFYRASPAKEINLSNPNTDLEQEIHNFIKTVRYYNVKILMLDRILNKMPKWEDEYFGFPTYKILKS